MRRPIIPGLKERLRNDVVNRPVTSRVEVMERLRKQRTGEYLKLFVDLDEHSQVKLQMDSILESIEQQFMDVPKTDQLIGIVAKCYLDDKHDVHLLDRNKSIIHHIKKSERLPSEFEKARGMALHPSYALIEVYTDCIRAVAVNGEVSVVKE